MHKSILLLIENLMAHKERVGNEIDGEEFLNKYYEGFAYGKFHTLSSVIDKLVFILNTENENGGKKDASNDGKPM